MRRGGGRHTVQRFDSRDVRRGPSVALRMRYGTAGMLQRCTRRSLATSPRCGEHCVSLRCSNAVSAVGPGAGAHAGRGAPCRNARAEELERAEQGPRCSVQRW